MSEKKNGTVKAAAPKAAPAAAGEKKPKNKLPFTALLNKRLDKIESNTKLCESMFRRAGKGIVELEALKAQLAGARTLISDLPADFKPARVAGSVQPMAEGTKVEIVPDRRVRFEGLLPSADIAGAWTVSKATPTSIAATSDVSGVRSVFARRDVQLPGTVRVKRPRKAKADGAATAAA